MHPTVAYDLVKMHGQDLAREAEIDRLAREASGARRDGIRRRMGRGLVRVGLALAGACSAEALERPRARAEG